MSTVAQELPVTHVVEAGREVVAGAPFAAVAWSARSSRSAAPTHPGVVLLRYYEHVARRQAPLDLT